MSDFVDLRINKAKGGHSDDSVWPSFTDIMSVIVMIFLMSLTAILIQNSELIKNLQIIDKDNEYFIFVKPDQDTSAISSTKNFNIIEIPGGPYPIWEQYKLPKIAKAYKCDILHCTSNTAPLFGKIPLVTTLHDIIYMENSLKDLLFSDASAYQKFGNLYRRLIVTSIVKKSTCQVDGG